MAVADAASYHGNCHGDFSKPGLEDQLLVGFVPG